MRSCAIFLASSVKTLYVVRTTSSNMVPRHVGKKTILLTSAVFPNIIFTFVTYISFPQCSMQRCGTEVQTLLYMAASACTELWQDNIVGTQYEAMILITSTRF